MSLASKEEYVRRIYERYHRAGREHKSRILDELCQVCGYHRKAALRRLRQPMEKPVARRRGPKPTYERARVVEPLRQIWLASEQLCSKLRIFLTLHRNLTRESSIT